MKTKTRDIKKRLEIVKLKYRIVLAYNKRQLRVMFTREKLDSLDHYGEAGPNQWVLINPSRRHGHLVSVIKTLVHEAIHHLEPDWHHNKVYHMEQEVWKLLSAWEQQHLLLWAI